MEGPRCRVFWILGGLCVLLFLATFVSVDFGGDRLTRRGAAAAQIAAFCAALANYRLDVGAFPSEAQGLEALWRNPGVPGWEGPYLTRQVPRDPWGAPYRYRLAGGRSAEGLRRARRK